MLKIAWMAIATPNDVMSMVVGSALRTGLKAIFSMSTEPSVAAPKAARICIPHGSPRYEHSSIV